MTAAPARDLAAVTVTGRSLTRAAAYATAAFAMGERMFGWAAGLRGHGVYVVGAGEPRWVAGQRVQV
ncbi:hypothetical protein AB0J40_04105 [Amycolatopsis sp. NPDC049691]|uniref:hypothetical protein n=1 Tax=Amycolatopsis sp. NPDC049691 TaxID=3155155 RepID=UPI0034249764